MTFKRITLFIVLSSLITITACSGSSVQEKIYGHLEEAVNLEKDFEEQQNKIIELELKEQELYSQIIDLTIDELDEIKELSQQAIEAIDNRTNKVETEKDSLDASQEEFEKTKDLIAKLEEKAEIDKAEEMYYVMMDRYQTYDDLYELYINSLNLDKELYRLLQKEDATQQNITEQITKINEVYQGILALNEDFNGETEKYNTLKKEFYDLANIEVKYEED